MPKNLFTFTAQRTRVHPKYLNNTTVIQHGPSGHDSHLLVLAPQMTLSY